MRPEDIDPAYTAPITFVVIFAGIAIASLIWAYWPGVRREFSRRPSQATPMAIRRIPLQAERRSQAIPVRSTRRFPLRGIDRLLELFFKGGSISGF